MRHWNSKTPEPPWVADESDEAVVQIWFDRVYGETFTHESVGRTTRAMRRRLYKILLDGLASTNTREPHG